MISKQRNIKISKFLSLVLRHAPEKISLELDDAGWANVEDLLNKMRLNRLSINFEILQYVVETNEKKRFSFNENQSLIRANQGHSININHGFKTQIPPEFLYHGTSENALKSILKTGIDKRNRHHVHLSMDKKTALNVGQRHGNPIILVVQSLKMNESGHEFYLSENNVWLTDFVPTEYINEA